MILSKQIEIVIREIFIMLMRNFNNNDIYIYV